MGIRLHGSTNHLGLIGVACHAGDILCDSAGEQGNLLRKVANKGPQRIRAVLVQCSTAEPDGSSGRRPQSEQCLGETGFPGTDLSYYAKDLAG